MPLPAVPLATGTADVAGNSVPITSLSRADVIALAGMEEADAEVLIISAGTGSTPDEAAAWRRSVDAATAAVLLEEIAVLSGIRSRDPKARASSTRSSAR